MADGAKVGVGDVMYFDGAVVTSWFGARVPVAFEDECALLAPSCCRSVAPSPARSCGASVRYLDDAVVWAVGVQRILAMMLTTTGRARMPTSMEMIHSKVVTGKETLALIVGARVARGSLAYVHAVEMLV